jgi:hypothetical protein
MDIETVANTESYPLAVSLCIPKTPSGADLVFGCPGRGNADARSGSERRYWRARNTGKSDFPDPPRKFPDTPIKFPVPILREFAANLLI